MKKYKVKDIANDLGVSNKTITEILEKHCGVTKKTMTALEESELDIIFDVVTQQNKVDSLDAYFAARNNKLEDAPKEEKAEEPKAEKKAKTEKKIHMTSLSQVCIQYIIKPQKVSRRR